MIEHRIISDFSDLFWTLVTTIQDWSLYNDEASVVAATGFPAGTRGHHIYCSFWEVDDPDDVCSVKLANSGSFSLADFDDAACEFGSPPDAAEDIFLVGCFVKAA